MCLNDCDSMTPVFLVESGEAEQREPGEILYFHHVRFPGARRAVRTDAPGPPPPLRLVCFRAGPLKAKMVSDKLPFVPSVSSVFKLKVKRSSRAEAAGEGSAVRGGE